MVLTQRFSLDIIKPVLNRLKVVNGDTANQFIITIKNDGAAVTLDTDLHKIIAVFTRADGQIYTQDASCGVSFTAGGVVTINVRPASFRTGTNKITLQIYKRESSSATEYPLLLTTQEQTFNARAAAIPDSGAPNAPSQLPMLEQIIHDAGEAVTACAAATLAANQAAGVINTMLENIDNEPTQNSDHLVKSGGVYSFVTDKVQEAADDVRAQIPVGASANPLMDGTAAKGTSAKFAREDHVHPHDTSKQDVLTFDNAPTTGSNNPVKSGGIKAAIDAAIAAASKKNVYNVKHSTSSWATIGGMVQYQSLAVDSSDDIYDIAADCVFVSQVALESGKIVTVYEYSRTASLYTIYMKSDVVDGVYVTATLDYSGQDAQLRFIQHTDESPLVLHVASSTWNADKELVSISFVESVSEIRNAISTRPIEFAIDVSYTGPGSITITGHYYMRSTGWGMIGANPEVYMYAYRGESAHCSMIIQATTDELVVEGHIS